MSTPQEFVDPAWLASRGFPESTIRHWIHTGTGCGPLFGKVGKRRLAYRAELERWLASRIPGYIAQPLQEASIEEVRAELDRPAGAGAA